MRRYRLTSIAVPRHPVVRLAFSDGLEGELDLGPTIRRGPLFAKLADESFFRQVAIAPDGRRFGWHLDEIGREIDFGADAARADIETRLVEARADRFRCEHARAAE